MENPEPTLSSRFLSAASALSGSPPTPGATTLLRTIGYADGDTAATQARVRILRAAAHFRRIFRLPVPDAPGLFFFGAEADPASLGPHNTGLPTAGVAGSGLTPRQAFEACVGEGIEYLSQFARPGDPFRSATVNSLGATLDPDTNHFLGAVLPAGHPIDWFPVQRLTDAAASFYPADLCLRRAARDFVPPLKLSTGCAAGATPQAATLHALLELIERDAAALWWRGGRRPRAIPPNTETAALLTHLRQDQSARRTHLLDITTDLGIPVVAAFSLRNEQDGFAIGLACRPTQAEAARAAIFELCQSELSLHVIAAKRRESGDAALNDSDRHQLARAATLHPATCNILRSNNDRPPPPVADPFESLARLGIVAYTCDLTRPEFQVPVIRVIAPKLQSYPSEIITPRLAAAIAETRHTPGLGLF